MSELKLRRPKATSVNMAVTLGGLKMKNPVTVASGTFGFGREYGQFVALDALGAVTTKGLSLTPWDGNATPRMAETPSGMLNSIGLQNPGVKAAMASELPWLASQGATIIVNVSGHSIGEYAQVIEALEEASVDAYELNLSCPNVDRGGMTLGVEPESVGAVVAQCRSLTKRPLIVKLTPNVSDITVIAKAAESSGADGLSLINTLLGMAIDPKTRRPLLARRVGGLSGPAIKPIALRCVWECAQCVSIPILGMGGIMSGTDAAEFLLAGATAVAVGTSNFIDPCSSVRIIDELAAYCEEQGISEVRSLIGALES